MNISSCAVIVLADIFAELVLRRCSGNTEGSQIVLTFSLLLEVFATMYRGSAWQYFALTFVFLYILLKQAFLSKIRGQIKRNVENVRLGPEYSSPALLIF